MRLPALGEVVALEDARHRGRRGDLEELLHGERREPLPVVADVELGRVVVEDAERLLLVGLGVGVDDGAVQAGARLAAARGVADTRRVVADDEHRDVAGVLELAQLVEDDGVAEVDVRGRGVHAELDAQRTPLALGEVELGLERALREHVDGADHEVVDEAAVGHGSVLSRGYGRLGRAGRRLRRGARAGRRGRRG